MKSINKLLICTFVSLFICLPAFSANAKVTYVKGKVEVLKNSSWVQLNVGDILQTSDTVSTGFQSELKLEVGGSLMSLGALTRITIEDMSSSEKKDNVSVYLNTGAVRSKVNHPQDRRVSYTVKSPVAVASVRGTDFTITARGEVTCHEGAVVVFANTERNMVSKASTEAVEEEDEEAEEEASEPEVSTEADGTYGPATATTPADEITDEAPAGAIVVGKDQTVTIMTDGNTETPLKNAKRKADKVVNTITTAASQEAVAIGNSAVSEQKNAKDVENVDENPVTTGSLITTIILED